MLNVFQDEIAKLPDLAKNYLFTVHFYDLAENKWVDELSYRTTQVHNEQEFVFNEYNDFFVSKFFDKHADGFNCNIVIKFYDASLKQVCYEKHYDNVYLLITDIDELSTEGGKKITRTAVMLKAKNLQLV